MAIAMSFGQTLIINEVSNGEEGNEEYVELVVVDNTVVYNCGDTEPPCIDIRGWIFDDNSGYHGAGGAASGALRFSFDPLWSCVPVGTIILLYNNADFDNTLIPAEDLTLGDGNCRIVAPIDNVNLFESNGTTPGDVACSYPAAGWTPGGNWNNVLLRNGGDCARIVDLSGCEVFSLCYGDNDLNTLIYFEEGIDVGSGDAANTVFYFNDGDPFDQTNWSVGCADVPNCGVEEQTPGVPNNALNAAYIAQFNNGCEPITPVEAFVVNDLDADCGCTGQATASGSGSIPGYTYEWLDASDVPIGQTTATAINLCAGDYRVVVESSIGCTDTADVTIPVGINSVDVSVNSETICAGETVVLSAEGSIPGGTYLWSPSGETDNTISVTPGTTSNYDVSYTVGACVGNATATVTVNTIPAASFAASPMTGDAPLDVTFTNTSTGATSYFWDFGNGFFLPMPTNDAVGAIYFDEGIYEASLVAYNGLCSDTFSLQIEVIAFGDPSIHIPNVYTPNNDGVNDNYTITTENIGSLEGIILNRWGNVIVTFDNDGPIWDGKINGQDAAEGVYFIKYTAYGLNGDTLEGHTFLELIR